MQAKISPSRMLKGAIPGKNACATLFAKHSSSVWHSHSWLCFSLFGLIAAFLLLSGCAKKEEAQAVAPAPVQVTAVSQATIRHIVNGDGVLYPQDQASVIPKITSPGQKFYVRSGDHVKKGQVVASLEH